MKPIKANFSEMMKQKRERDNKRIRADIERARAETEAVMKILENGNAKNNHHG